jgi:hypothetical protein
VGDTVGLDHVSMNHWYDIALTLWFINQAKRKYPPSIFWMYCYLFHKYNNMNHKEQLQGVSHRRCLCELAHALREGEGM